MNRSLYFNQIEKLLSTLSYRILCRGKINLLDLNIYSETFFAELMNHLLDYNLININSLQQNIEGIDLIDKDKQIIVQVSSTCTKTKIENSLSKNIFQDYPGYRFKFIAITGNADNLKTQTFKNPHNVLFDPLEDIYDIKTLLNIVLNADISKQRTLYKFVQDELGHRDIDIVKVDTNLATVINILSKENLSDVVDTPEINPFEIERKIEFNSLLKTQEIIDDYKIYYSKLDEKYREFDKQGANKSFSVLSAIRKKYTELSMTVSDPDELFFLIISSIIDVIKNSKNYIEIPYEELELCVSIIVVDAFIRCKIFKNPEGYRYVVTG